MVEQKERENKRGRCGLYNKNEGASLLIEQYLN